MLCASLDLSDVWKANNSISTVELVQEANYYLIIIMLHEIMFQLYDFPIDGNQTYVGDQGMVFMVHVQMVLAFSGALT